MINPTHDYSQLKRILEKIDPTYRTMVKRNTGMRIRMSELELDRMGSYEYRRWSSEGGDCYYPEIEPLENRIKFHKNNPINVKE